MTEEGPSTIPAREGSGWRRFWDRGGFWRAVLLVLLYLGLYLATGGLVQTLWPEVGPENLFSSTLSVFLGLVLPLLVATVALLLFAWSLGWTRDLFARQPIRGRWWMWILPIVVLGFNILRFLAADYSRYSTGVILMLLLSGPAVGLAEEVLTRGLVVNILRTANYQELAVALLSSLLFALSHSVNIFSGQDPFTVAVTLLYTFFFGVAMYMTLRVTRSLVGPVLLHATTDPGAFLLYGGIDEGRETAQGVLASYAGYANIVVIILGFFLVWLIRGRVTTTASREPDAVGA